MQANGLPNPDRIAAGMLLLIPLSSNGSPGASVALAKPTVSPSSPPREPPPSLSFSGDLFRLTHYCLVGPMSSGRWHRLHIKRFYGNYPAIPELAAVREEQLEPLALA